MSKLLVVSIDAIDNTEFKNNLDLMPNIKKLYYKSTFIDNVNSVYPSLTYPAHTSMVTGVEPLEHGIISNVKFDPFEKEEIWNWYFKDIKKKTIFEELKKHNKQIATVFWPVNGGCQFVDYLMPEIWAHSNKSQLRVMLEASPNKLFTIKSIIKNYKYLSTEQPKLDTLNKNITLSLIKKKVDVIFSHLIMLDDYKHKNGLNNSYTREALKTIDGFIGEFIEACNDEYNIILLGDHSQKETYKEIDLKELFVENGYIDFENKTYKCAYHSNGGCCYIYDKDNVFDQKLFYQVEGIKSIKGVKNAPYQYVIDASDGYMFGGLYKAQHGYRPELNDYQTITLIYDKKKQIQKYEKSGSIIDNYKYFLKYALGE